MAAVVALEAGPGIRYARRVRPDPWIADNPIRVVALLASFVAVATGPGCGGANVERVPVTLLIAGDGADAVRGALEGDSSNPVDIRFAALPGQERAQDAQDAAPAVDAALAAVAAARQSYIDARFSACEKRLDIDTAALLGQGRGELARRVLFWRIACLVGAGEGEAADRQARAFAVMEFDLPEDVDSVTPEVEQLLLKARRAVERGERVEARITADVERVEVAVDGRTLDCVTPCTVELFPGDHVVKVAADGVVPGLRTVRIDRTRAEVAMVTTPAPPELAARQWSARYAAAPTLDTVPSMRLLARAVRGRNIILLSVSAGKQRSHLRGTLAVDGDLFARAERIAARDQELPGEAPGLLRELLVRGEVLAPPAPLYRRRGFWIAVTAVAVVAAGVTGAILYQPETRQVVTF